MFRKKLYITLIIVFLTLGAGFQILMLEGTQAQHAHGEHEESEAPASPKGPHGGRLLSDQDLKLEVRIFEQGIPPEFRVYLWDQQMQPLPLEALQLRAEVKRLGLTDHISFRRERDYWVGEQEIYEPHSFEAVFYGVYQGKDYRWSFTQKEGRITIPPELFKRAQMGLKKAGPAVLHETLTLPGKIALDQAKYVDIHTDTSGLVENVFKHVGETVRQGDVLAVIRSREVADVRLQYQLVQQKLKQAEVLYQREHTAWTNLRQLVNLVQQGGDIHSIHERLRQMPIGEHKGALLRAYADLRMHRQAYDREKQLQKNQATSRQELQAAQTAFDKSFAHYTALLEESVLFGEQASLRAEQSRDEFKAESNTLQQQLRTLGVPLQAAPAELGKVYIKSPMNGVITEKNLSLGQRIESSARLFVVADLSEVWAELQVPESQLEKVKLGQSVVVHAQNGKKKARGRISHSSPVVDPDSRRAEAHAHIDNPERYWRPGMFVSIEVQVESHQVPVAVQKSALQTYRDWTVVYAKFGDTFEIRPLELGAEDAQWVEVRSGLSAGQTYVADNSFVLKAELGKTAATHDH